ncbi:hypothetical protein ACOMHN_006610 [Nucella lapillus]
MAASRQHSQWFPSLVFIVVVAGFIVVFCGAAEAKAQSGNREGEVRRRKFYLDGQMQRGGRNMVPPSRTRRLRSDRPNIVMILTDDQDVLLGSLKAMPKLRERLTEQGAYFENMFVSTPMCCPSRSSILTGLYIHNHNVYTNNDNCSSSQWVREHEPRTFATYLQRSGYTTGYFGKYLNKYNGTYTPVGWDKWVGLVRNSRFYNYTLSYGGQLHRHYDNYYEDYLTDRIANDSVAFFKHTKHHNPSKPVMMVLSVPAPHGPEDAAPQYQHMFDNNTDHRTATWNLAPNEDKEWLLRHTQPMTPQFKIFTDLLQRRRLQTLQSVDDLVEKVSMELDMLGELDNTYMMYTSDHGYHLGQFGLIKGKSMSFDFDTRVPLIIKGPGITPRTKISNVASNVDLAVTILDMGGVPIPPHMDGESLLPLLKASHSVHGVNENSFVRTAKPWRDSVLLERGKVSKRMWKLRMKEEKTQLMQQNQKNLHLYLPPKQQKILRQCYKPRTPQWPCKPGQKWYCQQDSKGRWRLHKCRNGKPRENGYHANNVLLQRDQEQICICRDGRRGIRTSGDQSLTSDSAVAASASDQHQSRRFLFRQHKKKARSRLMRQRRSLMHDASVQLGSGPPSINPLRVSPGFDLFTRRCRILSNQTVSCDQDIYRDYNQWETHRERVDGMIKEYRKILDDLRNIRDHLLENRPSLYVDSSEEDDESDYGGGSPNDRLYQGDENCQCDADDNLFSGGRADLQSQRLSRRKFKLKVRAQRREERRQRKGKKKSCNDNNMKCFSHDNNHWKTPPYWHYGPFCFCSNANNNTYWCMRTINATTNFLYCEYITNFISYYDMNTDPDQLNNVAKKLNFGILQQLHDQLAILKVCQGRENCNLRHHQDGDWRDSSVYEDSSGEGGDDFGQRQNGEVFLKNARYEEEQDLEHDPDFF